MSSARDAILTALGVDPGQPGAGPDRTGPAGHPVVAWAEAPIERFSARFEARAGTLAQIETRAAIPAAVEAFRATHDLPARAAVGAALADLAWPADWAIHHRAAGQHEVLAVSLAFAGVAETGQLVMLAGPDSPTTHNFVPDNQVIVLPVARLVRRMEDAWAWLREHPSGMPRVVNCIAGPSRTADIEQTIQLGAHGPRRLHVLLVGSGDD